MSTFKIILSEGNIRKFRATEEFYDFEYFKHFLDENYEKFLRGKEYTLQYRDEDGDAISVGSQIEWDTMFESVDEGSIGIYVKIEEDGSRNDVGDEDEAVDFNDFFKLIPQFLPMFAPQFQRGFNGCPRGRGFNGCGQMKFYHLHQKALQMMQVGDEEHLQFAKNLILKALSIKENDPTALYNLACIESLLFNVDEALVQLNNAINAGYRDVDHMIQDSDFDNIRNTEEFAICVALASGGQEKQETPEFTEPEIQPTPETIPEVVNPSEPEELSPLYPEVQVPEEKIPSDEIEEILSVLNDMGISFDREELADYVEKYSTDLSSIISYYFSK